ncbi:MAG: LysM peptidoglycan-binding domain-containing protein [Clostridia bacterium]|nr:LysM peptidoglycan-binding domain-containing protein [Clostridia bacterium]
MAKSYTVVSGDTLGKISVSYYGVWKRWTDIVKANPQLEGRRAAVDGSPLIFPGDVLIIPDETLPAQESVPKETIVFDENAPQDFSLVINGKKFTGFTALTIKISVASMDAFSFMSKWNADSRGLRDAFRPFVYSPCKLFFGGDVIFNGIVLPPVPQISPDYQIINVQGYPLCGVLIDSCLPPSLFPAEYNGLDLRQIAETVCEPFGVGVVIEGDVGEPFDKVDVGLDDKIWDFLSKLAGQRGMAMTNKFDGRLLIYKPVIKEVSASFIQGEVPFISCVPEFDGQKMYSHITGYTKTTAGADSQKYTYENKLLTRKGVLRCYGKQIDDAVEGTLEQSVKALAGRMFAGCVKWRLTVSGHRDKNGRLYRENMAVSVKAPGAEIYRETKFLVDEVTLKRDDQAGARTELLLVLPGSRDGTLPEVWPWEE